MAEDEKPIRVVDRRMFTPEGDLRPGYEAVEEAPEPAPTPAPAAAAPRAPAPSEPPPVGGAPGESAPPTGTGDKTTSQSFIGLVSFLASNVYAALGIDPMTGETLSRREPAAARQMIDWLGGLESKTRGNLSFEESDLLARVLYELRMAYVEATRPPGREPPPAR
ncbi:MAG TPA: DUF1844 domain-containing protein [Thermoanaerobaculia bacterium]|nr:DUF1844 domain-containing protein [Thermoanaerobaculia bacterium]